MATNRKKKIEKPKKEQAQKLAEEIGVAFSDPKQAKPARKNIKPKAPVSGKLSSREQARSLWAPRVEPKAKPKKSK